VAVAVIAGAVAAEGRPAGLRHGLSQDDVLVRIETAFGGIDIAVDAKHAPVTAANFLKYVDAKLYDGGRFHRTTRPDNYTPAPPDRPAFQIVQADIDPARRGEKFPAIPLERTTATGLIHKAGTLSMPRGADADSATSGFVICLEDTPSLDYGSKRYPDGQGFAAFGRVVKGLDVVRRIQQQPTNKDADTAMGRQALTPPVTITRMSRIQ
jgi:peptidyl-prolyl cis-trans isomerase A (cyclophilin A)